MLKIEFYKGKITGIFNGNGERISLEDFIEEYINSYLYRNLGLRSMYVKVKEKENNVCLIVWNNYTQIDNVLFRIKDKRDKEEIEELIERILNYLIKNIQIEHH